MSEERKDTVHVPMVEAQKVEATEVDTEVHVKLIDFSKINLVPVEVTFQEYKPIKIQLNDKIPDLTPKDTE